MIFMGFELHKGLSCKNIALLGEQNFLRTANGHSMRPAHAAGARAGKYTPGGTKAAGPRSAMFSDERLTQVAPLLGLMRDVGSAHGGKTCAQVAINWTICKGALPIPGARSPLPCCAAQVLEGKSPIASFA